MRTIMIIYKFILVLSTTAQGTRKLLEISPFAISVGIQFLATAGKTKGPEQIRSTQLQSTTGYNDRMGK